MDRQDRRYTGLIRLLGVSRRTVTNWIANETQPDAVQIVEIAKYLSVTAEDLIYLPEEDEDEE